MINMPSLAFNAAQEQFAAMVDPDTIAAAVWNRNPLDDKNSPDTYGAMLIAALANLGQNLYHTGLTQLGRTQVDVTDKRYLVYRPNNSVLMQFGTKDENGLPSTESIAERVPEIPIPLNDPSGITP